MTPIALGVTGADRMMSPTASPIHHRERSAEIAWRERSNVFSADQRACIAAIILFYGANWKEQLDHLPYDNRVRDNVNSTTTSANKERQTASMQIPGLDATQKQVITVLKTTPEHWHSSVDPYSPLKAYVSVPTRYAVGKALRKQNSAGRSRRMESAETASPSVAEMNGQTKSTAARTQS